MPVSRPSDERGDDRLWKQTDGLPPYSDLHIYYLRGRLAAEKWPAVASFIGNWEEEDTSFLFFSEPADATVAAILDGQPHVELVDSYHMTYENWQGGRLEPMTVGRVYVAPPWQPGNPPENTTTVWLDPGVVFGSGQHATTRNCIEALQQVIMTEGATRLLDLGTGTGLLSLTAAALGCDQVLAVDLNFLAAQTAWRNVQRNRMQHQVAVVQGLAQTFIDCPADVVVANIHFDVMVHLLDAPGFMQKRWFVLSGLLGNQAKEIRERLVGPHSRILQCWSEDGVWHTFLGKNQPP